MSKFILDTSKNNKTIKKTYSIRTSYYYHLESLAVANDLSISEVINQCLLFSLNDTIFNPINDIFYDEAKYLPIDAREKNVNITFRTTNNIIDLINSFSYNYRISNNKVVNEAIKYALSCFYVTI